MDTRSRSRRLLQMSLLVWINDASEVTARQDGRSAKAPEEILVRPESRRHTERVCLINHKHLLMTTPGQMCLEALDRELCWLLPLSDLCPVLSPRARGRKAR